MLDICKGLQEGGVGCGCPSDDVPACLTCQLLVPDDGTHVCDAEYLEHNVRKWLIVYERVQRDELHREAAEWVRAEHQRQALPDWLTDAFSGED
ncbi:MAG: hypothetical protein IVW36_00860 [Dehalococcoidia bacterium]|nr:hypothetical protein [Dehalococcoidia bacterium]